MSKKKRTGAIDVARDYTGKFYAAPVGLRWKLHRDDLEGWEEWQAFNKNDSDQSLPVCPASMRGLGLKPGEGPIPVTLTREDEG